MKFDANGWLDVAVEIDYLNKSMSRQSHKITHLVIHGTAGGSSAEGIANYFATSDVDASAHIEVDQKGVIAQGIPLSLAAWANGVIGAGHVSYIREDLNPNYYTASIEFVKASTDNSDALTPIQQQVGFELIKCICDTYNIPKRAGDAKGGIIKHADIDPINRSRCPGTFPWNELWAYLAGNEDKTIMIGLDNVTVASHFTGDDNAWKCKDNGIVVGHGILNFYRKFGGDALCGLSYLGLPRSNELSVEGHPGVVQQEFERACVVYDPQKVLDNPPGSGPVYLVHVERDPRTLDLLAQISDLQLQLDYDMQVQKIDQLQKENAQLKALIDASNLKKINDLSKQIEGLSQVQ